MIIQAAFKRILKQSFNHLSQGKQKQKCMNFQFCSTPTQGEDELLNYEKYLLKFNQNIKKPHIRMKTEEERIIEKYLNNRLYPQIIKFIENNSNNTLCNATTASKIDTQLSKNYESLTQQQKMTAAYSLAKLRQTKTFDTFKKPIQQQLKIEGISNIECEKLIVFLCGELINKKSLRFISKIHPSVPDRMVIYEKLYQYIDKNNSKTLFYREKKMLLNYIGLLLDSTLNKKQNIKQKQRSHLQVTIESFLNVLNIKFQHQIKINNFYVDYLLYLQKDGQSYNMILEVNGNHHYTINGKLKGSNVLRNLIVNEYAPVRIVHYRDFLLSKGNTNKIAYLKSLLQEKMINWECQNKGMNSNWEAKLDQELLSTEI